MSPQPYAYGLACVRRGTVLRMLVAWNRPRAGRKAERTSRADTRLFGHEPGGRHVAKHVSVLRMLT